MEKGTNGLSIAAMVCGIVGLVLSCVLVGMIPAIIGLVLSVMCITKKSGNKKFYITGLITSILAIIIFIIMINAGINSHNDGANDKTNRISTQSTETSNNNNEKNIAETLNEETESDIHESTKLSDLEVQETDVKNGSGDTVLGKMGFIDAAGYDISYVSDPDFQIICDKIDSFKANNTYMYFTILFDKETGIVFTGCDTTMPVYGKLDETGALIKTIGYLRKSGNTFIYEESTEPSTDTSDVTNETSDLTMGQKNALEKATIYLNLSAFSYDGLIQQLEFDGFTSEEATYAADNCGADWNEQASLKAKEYLNISSFSRSGLIEQLEFDGFTTDQAEYGVTAAGY